MTRRNHIARYSDLEAMDRKNMDFNTGVWIDVVHFVPVVGFDLEGRSYTICVEHAAKLFDITDVKHVRELKEKIAVVQRELRQTAAMRKWIDNSGEETS